jgi:predicted trehalose synthase
VPKPGLNGEPYTFGVSLRFEFNGEAWSWVAEATEWELCMQADSPLKALEDLGAAIRARFLLAQRLDTPAFPEELRKARAVVAVGPCLCGIKYKEGS